MNRRGSSGKRRSHIYNCRFISSQQNCFFACPNESRNSTFCVLMSFFHTHFLAHFVRKPAQEMISVENCCQLNYFALKFRQPSVFISFTSSQWSYIRKYLCFLIIIIINGCSCSCKDSIQD